MTAPSARYDLTGRTALVTGAGGLLGRQHVAALVDAGACVVVSDIGLTQTDTTIAAVKAIAPAADLVPVVIDVTSQASVGAAGDDLARRGIEVDILVNNAAISPKAAGGKRLSSIDTTVDVWEHVFRVNFLAPIMLARGLIEELKTAKGSVVNVTSIAGSRVHPFAGTAYATSKAALASLTREMASDFGPLGIRVNAIAPGEIDTAILSPGTEEIVAHQIPLHRLGTPDEVAKIIYVLCTDTSSYVNGAEIHINGGQHV